MYSDDLWGSSVLCGTVRCMFLTLRRVGCKIVAMMTKVNVLGVAIDALRLEQVLERICQVIDVRQRLLIMHTNITGLNIAYEQAWYREALNAADLVFCDGMGVKLGARLLGQDIPQRFTLADWMWPFAELAAKRGDTLFLLGNPLGVAERAAARLRQRFPTLRVGGTQHGFFDKTPGSQENEAVIQRLNACQPDIVMVGLGMPLQEKWLHENWPRLDVKVAITCGALFEYLAGDLRRGPQWMTDHYLEWLARLLISPRRYTRRYLRDNPLFLYRVLKQKFAGEAS